MAKSRKNTRSRFEGLNLDGLTKDAAKVTNQPLEGKDLSKEKAPTTTNKTQTPPKAPTKKQGRPKASKRKPLNTAIEPLHKKRLEFVAMLNGGSVADQLNNILEKYFTEIEQIDELIEIFEAKKQSKNKQ